MRRELGPIDILVNAAGMAAGGPLDGDDFVETWQQTLAVNLTGAMLMVRECLADLKASEAGRIVNIASTEALTASRGSMPYTVSKHGVLGLHPIARRRTGRAAASPPTASAREPP